MVGSEIWILQKITFCEDSLTALRDLSHLFSVDRSNQPPVCFVSTLVARFMAEDPLPFFATTSTKAPKTPESPQDALSLEDEVEGMVQTALAKSRAISKLTSESGMEFAPWMNISEKDEDEMRQVMKEKAKARRKRDEETRSVSGNLYFDSQAQELSGTGLNWKKVSGGVELEWATNEEKNCKGFIIKRRPAKTTDFSVIASYADWGPLVSKGADGGIYRFLDTTATPGGWVYRITECDTSEVESDVCQCLVEVQTEEEQRGAVFAAVGFAVLAIAAVVGGILLDPMDGF